MKLRGETFDSFDDAWSWISEFVDESEHDDLFVVEVCKHYNWTSTGPGGCDAHCIEHPCGRCLAPELRAGKHTRGPWIIENVSRTTFDADTVFVVDPNQHDASICTIDIDGVTRDRLEDLANARLIAAAPDLLFALEHIRADINDPLMDFDQETIVKRYTDYINKVLAKATGGAE